MSGWGLQEKDLITAVLAPQGTPRGKLSCMYSKYYPVRIHP